MGKYQTRTIRFSEVVESDGWRIKVYTISGMEGFHHPVFYQQALQNLPVWLKLENGFDDTNDRIAFLILHAGTEGIFSLINWWVGENMLNTHIFITDPQVPNQFSRISGQGLAHCVWELEIVNHERISWTTNILKRESADYDAYLLDTVSKEL